MTPEVRQRCLEPFFSTKGDKGTGLGLSMVFGIIQRHDGELEIDSEEGQGTTFRIRFKAAAADAEVVTVPPAGNVPPLRVLVVDDESVPRDVLSRYLTEDGHTVVAVDSGEAAVAQFESQDFDLLLTDYAMPTMNGPELAKRFVKRRPAAPVIVVTGFGGTELEEESKPEGVKLVLHKPVHLRALRAALADVCGVLR
jgi:CheY-like chemotaxis protein